MEKTKEFKVPKFPKLNEKLIAETLRHIEKFPESYDQNDVVRQCQLSRKTPCGSIGCFGGWGYLLQFEKGVRRNQVYKVLNLDTNVLSKAEKLFGFTPDEADFVFDGSETGDPKSNLKLIKDRLALVRIRREAAVETVKAANAVKNYLEKYGNQAGALTLSFNGFEIGDDSPLFEPLNLLTPLIESY